MSHLVSLAAATPATTASAGYSVYPAHKRQRVDDVKPKLDPTTSSSSPSATTATSPSASASASTTTNNNNATTSSATTSSATTSAPPTYPSMPLGLPKEASWSVLDNVNVDSFGGLGAMPSVGTVLEKRQFSISALLPPTLGTSTSTSSVLADRPTPAASISGAGGNQKYLDVTTGEYMYRDDVKPMTFPEKEALVQKITLLPSQYLRGLMDVISKYQPDTMRQIDDDGYAFDLGQMNENTVWAISDYVKDSMTELDGYIRSLSAVNASIAGDDSQSQQHSANNANANGVDGNGAALNNGNPAQPSPMARHPTHNLSLNNPKISAISHNENQGKFLEQVEMYSKPKVTKSRVKPSKKHECPTCQKQFRGRSELQNHIRTHTGEKPLKCSFPNCTKRYAHSSNLRAHERTHQGIKPYACHYDGCGKSFAHSVSLKEHIWMHAGFQPYVCPFEGCEKRFTQVSNFARHKKTHEKEERRDATL